MLHLWGWVRLRRTKSGLLLLSGHGEASGPAGRPVHHILQLVMVQLQPLLDGFNRSLEHLSQQVAELARNMEHVKAVELQAPPLDHPDQVDQDEEDLQDRLDHLLDQVVEVRWQMEKQRTQVENRLHAQHAMLHHNLTSFKMDVDLKLKRNQKMLQVQELLREPAEGEKADGCL